MPRLLVRGGSITDLWIDRMLAQADNLDLRVAVLAMSMPLSAFRCSRFVDERWPSDGHAHGTGTHLYGSTKKRRDHHEHTILERGPRDSANVANLRSQTGAFSARLETKLSEWEIKVRT